MKRGDDAKKKESRHARQRDNRTTRVKMTQERAEISGRNNCTSWREYICGSVQMVALVFAVTI